MRSDTALSSIGRSSVSKMRRGLPRYGFTRSRIENCAYASAVLRIKHSTQSEEFRVCAPYEFP